METSWKPSASRAERSAPIRPSIMSLGLTTSAPARAYLYGDFLWEKTSTFMWPNTKSRDEMNLWNSLLAQLINCFIIHNYSWCRTQTSQWLAGENKVHFWRFIMTCLISHPGEKSLSNKNSNASIIMQHIIQKTKLTYWLVLLKSYSMKEKYWSQRLKNKSSKKWFQLGKQKAQNMLQSTN